MFQVFRAACSQFGLRNFKESATRIDGDLAIVAGRVLLFSFRDIAIALGVEGRDRVGGIDGAVPLGTAAAAATATISACRLAALSFLLRWSPVFYKGSASQRRRWCLSSRPHGAAIRLPLRSLLPSPVVVLVTVSLSKRENGKGPTDGHRTVRR